MSPSVHATKLFQLGIVDAEVEVYRGWVRFLVAPAVEGELGVLAGHQPLLALLRPGELRITPETGEPVVLLLSGGFMEIQPAAVTILADTSLRIQEVDMAKALAAEAHAREVQAHGGVGAARALSYARLLKEIALMQALRREHAALSRK